MIFHKIMLGLLIVLLSTSLLGEEKSKNNLMINIENQLSETIDFIFQEDYISADSICQSILDIYPDHPVGYFMRGILHWRKGYFLNDYNDYNDLTLKWFKQATKVAKENIKHNPNDATVHFFAGGAYGYEGSVYARRKSWFKTGKAAYRGIRELEKSKKLDPELYDIYYGSGLYHVLASHQASAVKLIQKILPIPAGDSEKGLNYLQLAIEKGKFTNLAAKAALALAYVYYEENYQEAIDLLTPLIEQYPQNLDFLTNLVNAYFFRELTNPVSAWEPLSDVINQTRKAVESLNIDFQQWWVDKFHFIEGFMNYMNGNYVEAQEILSSYCKLYPKKGHSYLSGLGYLTLGKIADLQGNRETAIKHYKKVKKLENIGNAKELAKRFIIIPFQGENPETKYVGVYVDLPDRP